MKTAVLSLAAASLLVAGAAHADLRGGWTVSLPAKEAGRLHLQLHHDDSNLGQTVHLRDLEGLTAGQVASSTRVPVSFTLRREAGLVSFEGTMRQGAGGGDFTFQPNPAYLATLRELGVSTGRGKGGESLDEELLSLAALDVSTEFIRSMQEAGYRESLDEYVSMRIFHVTPELAAEYRELGISPSADDLVAGQIHGVSPAYVREMRELLGAKIGFDDLVATRIHGATPAFIAEMEKLGYGHLDLDDYVAFRIHGVTAKMIRELQAEGYGDLSADDLVGMRIHGRRRH
jgi:hypothetical protein